MTVTLTEAPKRGTDQRLLVVDDTGVVDVRATLEGLRDLPADATLLLEERYSNVQDGVGLLLWLRMTPSNPASRLPVWMRLTNPVERHVRAHPKFAVLCTDGVEILHGDQTPEGSPRAPQRLDEAGLLRVLQAVPIRSERDGSRHDLANRWGPVRLWHGIQSLRRFAADQDPAWVTRAEQSLRSDEPYAYLLALADLRESTPAGEESRESWTRWRSFAKGLTVDPLRVLLLDDEIETGWGEAVQEALNVPGRVMVDTSLGGVDFDAEPERVEAVALGQRWDLVLCDLRTSAADRSGGPSRGAAQYAGAEWVRGIKAAHPDTGVVAFTASDKAWSVQELRDVGVDGYWTKESPEYGTDDTYSAQQAAALVDTVGGVLWRRVNARPVWALHEGVTRLSRDAAHVSEWAAATGRREDEARVADRLASILARVTRAYGFLVMERSAHAAEAFAVRPYDLAFLALWGCLNEVGELYFASTPREDFQRFGEATFVRRSPRTRRAEVYWRLSDGEVTQSSVPGQWKGALIPPDRTRWMSSRADTARVAWLLDTAGGRALADRFDSANYRGRPGLRELRNHLEDTHGRVETAQSATLDDVHALCDVWQRLLVAPYV